MSSGVPRLKLSYLRHAMVLLCLIIVATVALVLNRFCCGDQLAPERRSYFSPTLPGECQVPSGGFKAWNQGVVTMLEPEVSVNCFKVLSGNISEIDRVGKAVSSWKNAVSDQEMLKKVRNCTWLRRYFDNNLYNSEREKAFPLAFTFVVYDSPQQVLRLLRLMYRPQNAYCIHYDAKSQFRDFFQAISECFHNIIVPKKLERVVWSHYSILGAQMSCMKDLLEFRVTQVFKWNYVLNICGKELPLITLRELVTRLMRLNGTSSIRAFKTPHTEEDMSRIKFPVRYNRERTKFVVNFKSRLKPPFDVETRYYKSEAYVMVSYAFAKYLMTDPTAVKIHNFFKECKNPEEHFYATMYRWPGAPGAYDPKYSDLYFSMESVYWTLKDRHCRGKELHHMCIVSIGDVQEIVMSNLGKDHVFHNKYFMDYDHTVMNCMEERIVGINKLEYDLECPTRNHSLVASG